MSDIKSKTSRVKLLLSVLFYFRTFCSIVHSYVKENHVCIFAYVFVVLQPVLCISIIVSIMAQVWISNLRVAEIKLLALETRPIVSTENVSFVLKRVAIDLHTLLSFSDNSDLIACMVVSKDGCQAQRFLAVDVYQMSLVEPETKRLGWGVVKFAGLLQVSRITTCLVVELAT